MLKKHVNQYGNVDIRNGVPAGLIHFDTLRLGPLARKLGIPFAPAMVGWKGTRRHPKPELRGIVIAACDEAALRMSIADREARNTPETRSTRQKYRLRAEQRKEDEFAKQIRESYPNAPKGIENDIAAHAMRVGSGRIGRSLAAEDRGVDRVRAAVVAHIRHCYTNYDELLANDAYDDFSRADARSEVAPVVYRILDEWKGRAKATTSQGADASGTGRWLDRPSRP